MKPGLLIVILFVFGTLAGCISQDPQGQGGSEVAEGFAGDLEPIGDDPVGDARMWAADQLYDSSVWMACRLAPMSGTCHDARWDLREHVPESDGVEAPPELDITGISLQETTDHLVVELQVAGLEEGFSGLAWDEGRSWMIWSVGWRSQEHLEDYVSLYLRVVDGEVQAYTQHSFWCIDEERGAEECLYICSYWGACWEEVEYHLEYGSPGTVRWVIPRHGFLDLDTGDTIEVVHADTRWWIEPFTKGTMRWLARDGQTGGDQGSLSGWYGNYWVDTAEGDGEFTFTAPLGVPDPEAGPVRYEAQEWSTPSSDMDIVAIRVEETVDTVTFVAEMARVGVEPEDMVFELWFAMPEGHPVETGFVSRDGEYSGWAGYPVDPAYNDWLPIPMDLELVPGEPGEIRQTFHRSDLGQMNQDESFGFVTYNVGETVQHGAGEWDTAQVEIRYRTAEEQVTLPIYRFREDTAPVVLPPGDEVEVLAPTGDVDRPDIFLDEEQLDRFDIIALRTKGLRPDLSEVYIQVDDLSAVEVPTGYDAVMYAAGVDRGTQRFMVAFLVDQEGRQEWFCSLDTAVFENEPMDPRSVVRTPIQSSFSPEAARSEIGFFVPHTCLGETEDGSFGVDQVAAGTFLLQDRGPLGVQVHRMDSVFGEESVTMGVSPVDDDMDTSSQAWYTAPFGVSAFWDIAGIAFAGLLALGGALLWHRRRSLLRRYLAEIQRETTVNAKRPRAQEEALLDIRSRAKKDFDRDRLRDEHFVLLEHRIEMELSRARIAGLEDVFGDLPHRLLENLKQMLSDGVLSQRDYRTLSALLDDSPLEKGAKVALREKLAKWLEQDTGTEVPEHPLVRP